MAQQSSTMTTFRAFVMLTCVLLIPLAAVCGTSYPSVVKAIQNGRWPTVADFRAAGENAKNGLSDAPAFVPARAPAANPAYLSPLPSVSVQPNAADSSVVPVNYEVPVASLPGQSTTFPQNKNAENRDFGTFGNQSFQPHAGIENPAVAQNSREPTGAGIGISPSSAGALQLPANGLSNPDATFKLIQDRLRELGATYYLLEAWGDRKDAFRFYCKMSMGGNPHVTRSFEHVDADPLKAMATVLQQIEDWQKRG